MITISCLESTGVHFSWGPAAAEQGFLYGALGFLYGFSHYFKHCELS